MISKLIRGHYGMENIFMTYTYTPWEWHEELYEMAKKEGLVCFSTPFNKSAVYF
jgi:pseudaminic acid synthase